MDIEEMMIDYIMNHASNEGNTGVLRLCRLWNSFS